MNTNLTPETPVTAPGSNVSQTKPKFAFPKFVSVKVIIIVLAVIALGALLYYYKGVFVAATIDGKPISRWAVIKEMEKQTGRSTLDALISKTLIDNEAKKKKVVVSDEEINSRITEIEEEVKLQGSTLDEMLEAQSVSREELRDQVELQKKAEKIIDAKIQVSDAEIDQYIKDSGQALEAGKEAEQKEQVRTILRQQKFSSEIATWLDEARKNASIKEFVNY